MEARPLSGRNDTCLDPCPGAEFTTFTFGVLLKLMYACLSALSRQHQLQLSRSVCLLQSVSFVHAAVSVWAHALLVHSVGAQRVHEMLPPVRRDLAQQAAAPPPAPCTRAPSQLCLHRTYLEEGSGLYGRAVVYERRVPFSRLTMR